MNDIQEALEGAEPRRSVHCIDAVSWLQGQGVLTEASVVGSLPDISEFPDYSLEEWKSWFTRVAGICLSATPDDGVTIFYQSDIKLDGIWVDKGYLCFKAAEEKGRQLLWHKIACRTEPGNASFGRPGYTHILCFSKNLRPKVEQSTADVLPEIGEKTWQRGMGLEAAIMIARFIAEQTTSKTVVNPFCGQGAMLAAANAFNLNAIGIERSPKRAELARNLKLSIEKRIWI